MMVGFYLHLTEMRSMVLLVAPKAAAQTIAAAAATMRVEGGAWLQVGLRCTPCPLLTICTLLQLVPDRSVISRRCSSGNSLLFYTV